MASVWFVLPEALCRARNAQLLTQEDLAKRSGVSGRSIRAYERDEQRVRLETLQCLAKALAADVKDIAVLRSSAARKTSPVPPAAPPVCAPIAPRAPEPPSAIPTRTALETLVDLERAVLAREPPAAPAEGEPEPLTAKRLQDVFTAYLLHDGARFVLEGLVDGQRGVASPEARLLGGRGGVAARFHILKEVVPGRDVGITVHTATSEHTMALQRAYSGRARVVLRVVVVPEDSRDEGFSSFISKFASRRPWTFVVEDVRPPAPPPDRVGAAPEPEAGTTRE